MGIQTIGIFSRHRQVLQAPAAPPAEDYRHYRLLRHHGQPSAAPAHSEGLARIERDALALIERPAAPPAPTPAPAPAPRPIARPPAPAPRPTPAPAPKPAPRLELPGLRPGARLSLADGTSVQGHSISGSAQVIRFDGRRLEMVIDASAAMGFVRLRIGLRCELQDDGTMRIAAHELGRDGAATKRYFDDRLEVVSSGPGRIVLKDPQGQQGSLNMAGDGTVVLEHPAAGRIVLQPS